MGAYQDFAMVYDRIMGQQIDYDRWLKRILKWAHKYRPEISQVCELGCGTGTISWKLSGRGYQVTAVDQSTNMLSIARAKADVLPESANPPFFVQQDMTKLELIQVYDLFLSTGDALNYISPEQLGDVFQSVRDYLVMDGLFIFDLNTEHKFKKTIGNRIITEIEEDYCYLWENYYDQKQKTNHYIVDYFIQGQSGQYHRTQENHMEYVHSMKRVLEVSKEYGFELVASYDDYSKKPVTKKTDRICYILKKKTA